MKLKKGDKLDLKSLVIFQKTTKPPSRYSQARLIKVLEDSGIGRPSTYATIISTLLDRKYCENQKGKLVPTSLGMKVSEILSENFEEVVNSDFTAKMEEDLDKISSGELNNKDFLQGFWPNFKHIVEEKTESLVANSQKYRVTETDVSCPKCSAKMNIQRGRFGEYYQCTEHAEHQFALNFVEYEKAVVDAYQRFHTQTFGQFCEVCQKQMIVRVSKSTLKPYIACPDYKVGNGHTVTEITLGDCPKCLENGKTGKLVQKTMRGRKVLACNLSKAECGYIENQRVETKEAKA